MTGHNSDVGIAGGAPVKPCQDCAFFSGIDNQRLLRFFISNNIEAVGRCAPAFKDLPGRCETARDRKRAEEASRLARRELAMASRCMTLAAMSAGLAHELKQALGAIVANAEAALLLLSKAPPDLDETSDALRSIAADGYRACEVIQSVRGMFVQVDQATAAFNVNDLIRESVALAHGELDAAKIAVRLDLGSELPSIHAHRVQMQQVLLNLVANAIEAMRNVAARTRKLQIVSRSLEANGIEISVIDSGTGIAVDDRDRIFDPFFTTKSNGMGMGLSICRSIIELQGGRLSVEAANPCGSIFRIVLPQESHETSSSEQSWRR